jgi:hypothetical protein
MKLTSKQKISLSIHKIISFVFFPILFPVLVAWMKHYQGYRIHAIKQLRKEFKDLKKQAKGGLLICPNHLTFIDSLLLIWAFSSPFNYMKNFRTMSWNLPKESHVSANLLYRVICYLGKCLLISTDNIKNKDTMDKASYLINKGEYMMVFPEGTRSVTGRIFTENFVYGVGKLFIDSETENMLCVYIRGDKQLVASKMPEKADRFTINLKLIQPQTSQNGRRAMRDVSNQIIDTLVAMELQYFEGKPDVGQ